MNGAISKSTPREPSKRGFWRWVALALLALLLLLIPGKCGCHRGAGSAGAGADSLRRLDSLRRADSLRIFDSLSLWRHLRDSVASDSLRRLDSLRRVDSIANAHRAWDRMKLRRFLDSLERMRADSLHRLDSLRSDSLARWERAHRDTTPPHVFADPAAGVHPAPVEVGVLSEEASATPLCGPDSIHLHPCRDLVRVTDHTVLWISAVDTAGNRSPLQRLEYVINSDASRCGARRVAVMGDSGGFCVDAFEYPNDPTGLPRTAASWEEAHALCAKAGKRLCSAEELTDACRGPKDWEYPYGPGYVPGHCQDGEGSLVRGMSKPGCRSWWGAFHLVGNAWEWTSTKAGSTYLAHGGTFIGGPEDRCGRTTRSFYRQNKYESVGFRCCDSLPSP